MVSLKLWCNFVWYQCTFTTTHFQLISSAFILGGKWGTNPVRTNASPIPWSLDWLDQFLSVHRKPTSIHYRILMAADPLPSWHRGVLTKAHWRKAWQISDRVDDWERQTNNSVYNGPVASVISRELALDKIQYVDLQFNQNWIKRERVRGWQ